MTNVRVTLPADRVEELKQKYNLTDEGVQDLLGNVQLQETTATPSRRVPMPDEDEEGEEGMYGYSGLAALAKKGGGSMGDMMGYALLQDIMERREDRAEERRLKREERAARAQVGNQNTAPSPEILELRRTVEGLRDTIQKKQEEEDKKTFAHEVVNSVNAKLLPLMDAMNSKIEAMEIRERNAEATPTEPAGDLRQELTKEIEKLGEKIAQQGSSNKVTLDDMDNILEVLAKIEQRFGKKEVEGDVNWRNLAINELGEIGKEFVHTYREIETEKRRSGDLGGREESPRRQTPMQQVMKRQVQNYIMRQLQAGQANLNVKEAARDLGITEQQVVVAYQQLEAEGWFRQSTGGMENGKQETPQASAPETSAEGSAEEQWRRRSGTGAHQDNVFGGKESQF